MGEGTGGGVDTDVGGAGLNTGGGRDTSPSTPASLGFGGARGDIVARETTPAPNVQPSRVVGDQLNNQALSGGFNVPTFSRYLQTFTEPVTDFFTGGTQTDDRGPSDADVGAVSVDDNQFNQGLASLSGVPDFVRIGGGTSSPTRNTGPFIPDPPTVNVDPTMAALRRGAPALIASNQRDVDQGMMMETRPNLFPEELGGGTIASPPRAIIDPLQTIYQRGFTPGEDVGMLYGRGFTPIDARQRPDPNEINMFSSTATQDFPPPGPGLGLADSPALARAIANQQGTLPSQIGDNLDANKVFSLGKGTTKPKTQEELNLLQRLGRFLKGVGKSISNFEMSDIFEFLRGDPNFKGTPSSAIDPFAQQGMGPGPFVGGGVPSPSGGGGMAMPAKDPCPPGFRFDPTLQQCVPIIAPNTPTDTTTTPTTPTTPAPGTSPPVAGGIANAYPFVLTPPIGAPVGNLPPVRLTT